MSKLPKKAVERIRAIQAAITAEPEMYDQTRFVSLNNPCGSACCIAGWAIWNHSPSRFMKLAEQEKAAERDGNILYPNWRAEADKALGVWSTPLSLYKASPEYDWPPPFDARWSKATTPVERAAVAVDRLNYLIETGR